MYKTANGQSSSYHYDPQGQLLARQGHDGQWHEYLYLNGEVIATAQNGVLYAVRNDQLGTTQALYDDKGQQAWQAEYLPFGKQPDRRPKALDYRLRFAGQIEDEETELYYNYFRDYDPATGRYIQSDPIGILEGYSEPQLQVGLLQGTPLTVGGTSVALNHLYGYANQNPLVFNDAFGLTPRGGERGATGGSSGQNSNNPYKHCRQHPTKTNKIQCKHHQTGKWIEKPKPADWPEDSVDGGSCPDNSNCQKVATAVVVGSTAYIVYRCIRMVPSLAVPPLWPTIPANAAIP